jgi:oligopeptide/dipeptide ABC transporter ATP-binding protein
MTMLLNVQDLAKHYLDAAGRRVKALDGVSFSLRSGEVLGIVGESGCGKSTLARTLIGLQQPTAGDIVMEGESLLGASPAQLKTRRRNVQMVFQDPFGSLDPRQRVGSIIAEPLIVHGVGSRVDRSARVAELVELVGLEPDSVRRYPHEFSGGQRQRIAIARALALNPRLVIADEPVSALDVSIQSQIINLIAELRRRFGLAMLFISHDLSVIRHVSDRIAVMYLGRIVEIGEAEAIFARPMHPYTKALVAAAPRLGKPADASGKDRIVLTGEVPDPSAPPPGCAFHPRCWQAEAACRTEAPLLRPLADARSAACRLL